MGARFLAVSLLAVSAALPIVAPAHAMEEESLYGKNKVRDSQKPLGPAVVSGKVTTETAIVAEKKFSPMLSEGSYAALQNLAARYRDIVANGGFPKVSKGAYKKGTQNKGVIALNRRLYLEGYLRQEATEGEFADRVTSATLEALSRFQRNNGLAVTGTMDGPTLAALNVPANQRLRTIEVNLPRVELYSQNLGDRYLVVNVPSQQIETVSDGRVYSRHNAIVGRPERPTPVVMTALSDVNFNPYWNTPPSIIERDLIPKLRSSTKVLDDMNIRVFQGFGGPEIDPRTVNWGSAVADDYHFRQEPGPANAMATAKINFPSPFGIYLHDTPEKHLFKSGSRFYSSGCVRVEKIELLLEWVLNGQEGIGASEISAYAETLEQRDVKLETPPQLRVTYLTAWPVGNTVAFRPDIYDLDGTGFTVGQPMPVGEVSDDGQRFVLKPVPRKASAVDAAEAEGIGLFGFRSKGKRPPGERRSFFASSGGIADVEPPGVKQGLTTKKQTLPFEKKKAVKPDKDHPGLFDWAAYKKSKKLDGKKEAPTKVKKVVKKSGDKKTTENVAVAAVKPKADPKKVEPKASKKIANAEAATPDLKAAKKPAEKDTAKKVATVDPKAPAAKVAKVPATPAAKKVETAKKPVEDKAKKVADTCKLDAAGKPPKDCKPAAKKP